MWTPADRATQKLLSQQQPPDSEWGSCVWQGVGPVSPPRGKHADDVLVWSGQFKHGLYGSELPAVRAAGVVDMPPEDLLELLVDSARVKEYNKLSLGRTDDLVLQAGYGDDSGPFGGVTKIMTSRSRPPLLRKTLQFTSILHAREMPDGSGYKIVTRAVTTGGPPSSSSSSSSSLEVASDVLTSEILMGVTVIKRIQGEAGKCLVTTVNHIRSPMLPMVIAKRIGLQAAVSFVHDLRACC